MRLFPVVMAIAVSAILYAWIFEREVLYTRIGIATQTGAVEGEESLAAEDVADDDTDAALIRVVARHSVAREIDTAVILRGQTEAARQLNVKAETSSTIISEPIRKGAFVEEGQALCVLDPGTRGASLAEAKARLLEARARKAEAEARVPENAARLAEAEARLEEALTNENVAVQLKEDGYASDTRVKNARAAVAAARAGVEAARSGASATSAGIESASAGIESAAAGVAAAQKEIDRLTITAPFSGLLETDTAELGALLQPGAQCATIIQLDPIKLVAFVPETEVDRVTVGARAGARLASDDSNRVFGTVTFLSRSADPTTRTFRVEIEVPNPDLAIRDGQTAEILIEAEGEKAHLLPASSLTLNDEGTLGLRIVDPTSTVRFQPVRMLRDSPEGVWLAGLPETADVIVVGQDFVTEGVPVAVTLEEAPS